MANYELIFSPTGGTQRVAELLGGSLWNDAEEIDLMDRALEEEQTKSFSAQDCCLVAVPCFGGRVPDPARRRLEELNGGGARAILVVVYGNRAYDDTFLELKDTLVKAGFRPVAAVAAVAEHSIMRQFAAGRPDQTDAKELASFAQTIRQRLEAGTIPALEVPGENPYRPYPGLPMHPKGTSACTSCGRCARVCPVGAIDPAHPRETDQDKCITCMACVARCPRRARRLRPLMVFLAGRKMKKVCGGRKPNQLF